MTTPRKEFTRHGLRRVVAISLHPDQQDALDVMAGERGSNRSKLIREAIDLYLRANGRFPRDTETAAS